MNKEKMAIKISETLNDLCPSFVRHGKDAVEWHKCSCKATDGPCICVWHLTNVCPASTWEKLSFVKSYQEKKTTKQDITMIGVEVVEALKLRLSIMHIHVLIVLLIGVVGAIATGDVPTLVIALFRFLFQSH